MRYATAALCRQAFFAAAASVVLACAMTVGVRGVRLQHDAAVALNPPILARTVIVGPPRADTEVKASEPAIVRVSTGLPAPVRGPLDRRECGVSPCLHSAAVSPSPRHRAAPRWDAALIKVALTPAALEKETTSPWFSDRLLWPVGNIRDRVAGLMSSL